MAREEYRAYFIAFMKKHRPFDEEFEDTVVSNLHKSGIGKLEEGSIEHPWVWTVYPDEYLDAYIACYPLFQQHERDCFGCTPPSPLSKRELCGKLTRDGTVFECTAPSESSPRTTNKDSHYIVCNSCKMANDSETEPV